MPFCDSAPDWLPRTRNIAHYVLKAIIGYVGPALHQAVALDGNPINIIKLKRKHLIAVCSIGAFKSWWVVSWRKNCLIVAHCNPWNCNYFFRPMSVDHRIDKRRFAGSCSSYHWMTRNLLESISRRTRNLRMERRYSRLNRAKRPQYSFRALLQ